MADPSPLVAYLAVQKPYDAQMRKLLLDAADEAERIVKSYGTKTAFEKTRMLQARRDLLRLSQNYYGGTLGVTAAGVRSAARAAANSERWLDRTLTAEFGATIPEWQKAVGYSAENGIAAVLAKQKNAIPLSDRVYHTKALTDGKVDEILSRGLLLQKSADQIAQDVKKYISPNVAGGVAYAANRVARTEINNAFHAQQIESRESEPWTECMHWNLSGSHPVPDDCNKFAEEVHFKGGSAGDYETGKVPGKPHPNCLCFLTTKTIDEDAFVEGFLKGDYNSFIDSKIYGSGIPVKC